jgi:heterodisulfide reductase subunit C
MNDNKKLFFKYKADKLLPTDGNYDSCLTCSICASACPATGLADMDPKKFLRMAALGLDETLIETPWIWMCTMCQRCSLLCPMHIDIPKLVYQARARSPIENKPKGIKASCATAMKNDTRSAIGLSESDFKFAVEDVLEDVYDEQDNMGHLKAPIDKKGAFFFLNQNSREPATEAEEMVPLWKILDIVGADWSYASKGWAAENYCMFAADDENWEKNVRTKVDAVHQLGAKVWLNTE